MLKKKIILYILGFYVIWLGILPFIISGTIGVLCENFSHNSKFEIKIENPSTRLSVLPTMSFGSNKIIVKSKTNSFNIELTKPKIKIRLFPLLSGHIHINSLEISKVHLITELKEEMQLDKDFFAKWEERCFRFNAAKIGEFEAFLHQQDTNEPIIYRGKDFVFQNKNRYLSLQNNSTLNIGGKVSKVTSNLFLPKNNDINKTLFDIEISNVDIAPLRTYFKHYLPKDLKELQGFVNIHASKDGLITELTDCAAIMSDPAKSIVLPQKTAIKSKFSISRQAIDFEKIEILSKNIHIAMDGKLQNYFGKTMPTLDFNVRINQSNIEDIIKCLPAFNVEEINTYYLKKYKFYGDIFANFKIKGRLPEPDLIGDMYIKNAILIEPIPNTTRGANIKINLLGKYLNFDVFVPAGRGESVTVIGGQELYNIKYADFVVKSSSKVNLHVAQKVLNPLHEILNFIIGPVPILDIYGDGNIDIRVKGNRKNPHIWGVFNANNGKVNLKDIPNLILENAEAVLTFSDQNASFNLKNGTVNNKDFKLNGTCDLFGKFDFNATSQEQPTKELYQAILTSNLVPDLQKILPKLDKISGSADFTFKIYGDIKDIKNLILNENILLKGIISLKENNFTFENINIEKATGKINLDNTNADINISALISGSDTSIKGKIRNTVADLVLDIPKLDPNILIKDEELASKGYLPTVSVVGKYKGKVDNIEYDKLDATVKVLETNGSNELFFSSGDITVIKNKIIIKNLKGFLKNPQNPFNIDLKIDNAFTTTPNANGILQANIPDLTMLNEIFASDILPKKIRKLLNDFEFKKGSIDLNCKITNNKVISNTDLSGISFIYTPIELPISIINGAIVIKNNIMNINKMNILADKMPILIDGDIKDLNNKQVFDLYLNSKPQQEFIDKYINKNQIYPIKIKGDIVYWLRLKGTKDNYELKSNINLSKDSSFYHFGATVGDIENAIIVNLDSKVINNNKLKIKEFSYDKIIDSQSGKQTRLNMLKSRGEVEILNEDLAFKDLYIKTQNPTDARIFNIIFRKPNIKQGQFTSDLRLNGRLSNPTIIGDFHIFETNIPFFDTTMKNIEFDFKDKTVNITSKGEVMGSDVAFEGIFKNKLTTPYHLEKGTFYTQNLDLNRIANKLKVSQVDNVSTFDSFEDFKLSSITFKNLKFKADNIILRNIHATNYEATASLNDKGVFDINHFVFNIAQGVLSGNYKYNLKSNDTLINLKADSISANDISWALFDLNNQIYGNLTGGINLSCNGTNFQSCMQTLNGDAIFNVKDGRMPKLGSLEYLLKAGNLVKSGITGVSINSIIELIAPQKTGEFSDIYGSIRIKDGIARNIEISTKGKDLNLFMSGTYNFATSVADMEVLGLLSRKISTMLGPVGNFSINTLFNVIPGVDLSKDSLILERINKIPAIELSNKAYRKFIAEIKGNINGDDYVTSFKWIN